MIDYRFYQENGPIKLSQIAKILSLDIEFVESDDIFINSIAPLDEARPDDLAYCISAPNSEIATKAGACFLLAKDLGKLPPGVIGIVTNSPRAAFSKVASSIIRQKSVDYCRLNENQIETGAKIHKSAIIGQDAAIGENSSIGANSYLGVGVHIGRNCEIGQNCVIECSYIGDNVKIGANSIIGKAGFGVVHDAKQLIDVPHFGRVIIQDNVTIGALCTIDRGAFGDTIIGLFTKIDNHCHIAHNVKIGTGVIMAAFAGISGSVEIGDYVMMGGRVGIGDHFKIGAGAKLAAGSAVLSDVPAGETYGGYPAKPRMKWLREIVKLAKLSEAK